MYTDTSLEFIISIVFETLGPAAPRDVSGLKPTFEVFILYLEHTLTH